MADVFISYSRLDQERVQPIADRLSSLGHTIWWDKHERAGAKLAATIAEQIENARVVLVVWSLNARNSTWVIGEASHALDTGKLVQLKLDNIAPPAPFDTLPIADVSNERGAEWGPLEHKLAQLKNGQVADYEMPRLGAIAAPAASGAPKLIIVAAVATFAAFFGALLAVYNGLMTADQLQIALLGMIGVGIATAAIAALRLVSISRAGG